MFDLDTRTSRYEQEQLKRREEARRKKEREDRLAQAQLQREQELAVIAAKRQEEREAAELARELAEAEERQLTGGVKFQALLQPYAVEGEDDKVLLPESCLTQLTEQDVFGKRPALFRLTVAFADGSEATTHCGVREFSAPEGSIGLPPKIVETLRGDLRAINNLQIKYVMLSKATFVKLKPKDNQFFEVGPVKRCLEENLVLHSTLSLGDVLTVWYRGTAYRVVVKELRPEPQGSLLDTDLEVDLDVSEEYDLRSQTQPRPPQQPSLLPPSAPMAPTHASTGYRLSDSTAAPSSSSSSATETGSRQGTQPSAPGAQFIALLPEPDPSLPGQIAARFKMPSGKTISRRFLHSSPLRQLFYFVQLELQLPTCAHLQLSTRFPARTLGFPDSDISLSEGGITESSEQFFVKQS